MSGIFIDQLIYFSLRLLSIVPLNEGASRVRFPDRTSSFSRNPDAPGAWDLNVPELM